MHTGEPAKFPLNDEDEDGDEDEEHRLSNYALSWTVFRCLRNGNGSQRYRAKLHRDDDGDGGG
jgi:hypothetical protein